MSKTKQKSVREAKTHNGLFISFEGGEGVGKSSVIARLNEALASRGYQVIQTREPGGCKLGIEIRSMLLHHKALTAKAEFLLFLANRAQHVEEVIEPALQGGQIVLCDRFTDSTLAYQMYARKSNDPHIREFCDFATGGLTPDITFLLDLDPKEGLQRLKSTRGGFDRIEQEALEFHQAVREGFLAIARREPERMCVVDASLPLEEVISVVIDKTIAKYAGV